MFTAAKMQVAVAAAIGGIAPNILRIAMCLTGEDRKDPGVNFGYVVGLILLAGLGYLVALIWNERTPRRAFYLGMGLPAMLQLAMISPSQGAVKSGSAAPATSSSQSVLSFFSTSAFAQQPTSTTPPAAAAPRKLMIQFRNVPTDAQVVFLDKQGHKLGEAARPDWEKNADAGNVVVPVPANAAEVEIVSSFSRNSPDEKLRWDPQSGTLSTLFLHTKADFTAGLLKALGRQAADSMKLSTVKPTSND